MKPISSTQLQDLIQHTHENGYQIVDVRPKEMYQLDHIPGADNIPLSKLLDQKQAFSGNQMLVFCCRNGIRSKVAACLVSETGYPSDKIYSLTGGLNSYSGEILLEEPRLKLFQSSSENVLQTAFSFEKGAWLFYQKAYEMFDPLATFQEHDGA